MHISGYIPIEQEDADGNIVVEQEEDDIVCDHILYKKEPYEIVKLREEKASIGTIWKAQKHFLEYTLSDAYKTNWLEDIEKIRDACLKPRLPQLLDDCIRVTLPIRTNGRGFFICLEQFCEGEMLRYEVDYESHYLKGENETHENLVSHFYCHTDTCTRTLKIYSIDKS